MPDVEGVGAGLSHEGGQRWCVSTILIYMVYMVYMVYVVYVVYVARRFCYISVRFCAFRSYSMTLRAGVYNEW